MGAASPERSSMSRHSAIQPEKDIILGRHKPSETLNKYLVQGILMKTLLPIPGALNIGRHNCPALFNNSGFDGRSTHRS